MAEIVDTSDDSTLIAKGESPLIVQQGTPLRSAIVAFEGVVFPHAGEYTVHVAIDGKLAGVMPLPVIDVEVEDE
ncbi:MAG: hypothetical protein IT462_01865 [Planctomycetes bacterium]|nr:hypothetical protein [Planctomycetota bacterium]